MRVLVTGGTGFIGAHVVSQLVELGHAVACFDLKGPTPVLEPVADDVAFVRGDVTDAVQVATAVAEFDPDRIVHLASLLGRGSQANPRRAIDVNVSGTLDLLEIAAGHGVDRVVVASSVSSYGHVSGADRLDETVPQHPENVYGLTKYVVERLGDVYRSKTGIEFAAMEPVHGLGPDRERGNVEAAFVVKAAVSGTPIRVPDVPNSLEMIYVGDTARAFVAAVTADAVPHDRYLVGSGERATLAEIVEMVRGRVPDADLELFDPEDAGELALHPLTDTSRLREDFGWEPRYSIEEAVEVYVEWLEANPEKWSFREEDVPWM